MKYKGSGGANTRTGLVFEGQTDLASFLSKQKGYEVLSGSDVFYQGKQVGYILKKYAFYRFIEQHGVKWKKIISKRILPDDSIYVIVKNTLYVLECKFQRVAGSVDEKLQTCDFKKKQYRKLLAPLNKEVEYIYILSSWFKKPEYKDVLDYIRSVGCSYYFEYLPLQEIGLPLPG